MKGLLLLAAIVSFACGLVLAFIPGPAVVFFAITCALLAVLSPWVARRFDVIELKLRYSIHSWKRRRRARAETQA